MAISLKKLYLLPEFWTTTDFINPETGEKDTAQHWEPSSGYKLYRAPNIDVTKRAAADPEVRAKSTQMFYDFYATELLHALFGSSREMSTGSKIKATLPLAAKTDINPALIGIDWDNVTFPLSNVVLPEKLRIQVDTMYEEVTIALAHKLQEHLRRSVIQELRHIINYSSAWQEFRKEIVTKYNIKQTLSKEEFVELVKTHLPNMVNHLDSVKRLLLFSKYYSSMGSVDPATIIGQGGPSKEKDDPSKYYDIDKDSSAIDISKKKDSPENEPADDSEQEPDDEVPDYQGWEPDADTQFDPEDPYSKKVKKQWKDKLKEDYASGKISPSTIRTINKAINKAGVTWQDVVLAYNNIAWDGAFGGKAWGEAVVSYLKLAEASKKQNIDKMVSMIDHIYDLAHNSGPLLNKGGMYITASDLDRRSKITHIARFLPNVSAQVKQLILNVLRYLPGTNIEVEKNIVAFLNVPTIPFTPEQREKLVQNNFVEDTFNMFVGGASFVNKQKSYVSRFFYAKAHNNGKFTISDSLHADIKVFDTFEELDKYITNVLSKEIAPSGNKSKSKSSAPTTTTTSTASSLYDQIANYTNTHARVKLPSDKAQLLFDYCKMGWREKGKYYKAYIGGSSALEKRILFYAFSDGTYLVTTNQYEYFSPTSNWESVFKLAKALTINAIPYPDPDKAKAHIASGTSPLSTPIVTPTATATPTTTEPQTSVTPTAYPSTADKLPFDHSDTSAAYFVHNGISAQPTKTIRLTKVDEEKITDIGFQPNVVSNMIWYIHSGTGDVVKFFPNNSAKIIFSKPGQFQQKLTSSKPLIPIVITFTIEKMLQWLSQKYTKELTVSPLVAPASNNPSSPPSSTKNLGSSKGINPGALFNPQLKAAGFTWDESSGKYFDGQNSLLINPDRTSSLYISGGVQKYFQNLPELIAYLSSEYAAQKKN